MRIQTDTKATHKAIPTILELSIAEEPQVVLLFRLYKAGVIETKENAADQLKMPGHQL